MPNPVDEVIAINKSLAALRGRNALTPVSPMADYYLETATRSLDRIIGAAITKESA